MQRITRALLDTLTAFLVLAILWLTLYFSGFIKVPERNITAEFEARKCRVC